MLQGAGGFALAAPILSVINEDLGPDPNVVWIALGYTLPLAIGFMLVGRLSDLFGRRYFFMLGAALALIGAIVCATAQSVSSVIAGTCLIGVAAATQLSVIIVMGELVPMKYRFVVNAAVFVWVIPYSGVAPAVAYAFVGSSVGWRGCYYLLIATDALALACWALFYFPPTFAMKHHTRTKTQVIKDFDFLGLFLFCGGFIIFLLGLSWGGSTHPWKSAWVIGTLICGGFTLIIFVCWECRTALREPLIPMHLFRNGKWVAMICVVGLSSSVYYAFTIVFPQIVFALYTTDTVLGGWLSSLVSIGTVVGQILSCFSGAIGKQRWQFTGSMVAGGSLLAGKSPCLT